MAALSHCGTLFVMTHDSIGLGEDGPTHQPVEHLASFRAMPNILMLRPGDGNETAGAYQVRIHVQRLSSSACKARTGVTGDAGICTMHMHVALFALACRIMHMHVALFALACRIHPDATAFSA